MRDITKAIVCVAKLAQLKLRPRSMTLALKVKPMPPGSWSETGGEMPVGETLRGRRSAPRPLGGLPHYLAQFEP